MTSAIAKGNTNIADAIERIGARLDPSPLVLMLDVDGTLAPIAPTPAMAQLPADTRLILERLATLPGVVLAVVSGRAAEDAARLVGLSHVWVIGNHGYELLTPAGEIQVLPSAAAFEASMAEAARRLAPLDMIEGAVLEDKRWTLSVHYRNVQRGVSDLVHRVRSVAADLGLRVTEGKKVVELRPPIDVDKGTAALDFAMRHRALDGGAALYAGDDRTDEDAFRALKPTGCAVTAHIGTDPAATNAELVLPSPSELRDLLGWLAQRRLELR